MAKEIKIIPSDKQIKDMYNMKVDLGFETRNYETYYKEKKKPIKALFG